MICRTYLFSVAILRSQQLTAPCDTIRLHDCYFVNGIATPRTGTVRLPHGHQTGPCERRQCLPYRAGSQQPGTQPARDCRTLAVKWNAWHSPYWLHPALLSYGFLTAPARSLMDCLRYLNQCGPRKLIMRLPKLLSPSPFTGRKKRTESYEWAPGTSGSQVPGTLRTHKNFVLNIPGYGARECNVIGLVRKKTPVMWTVRTVYELYAVLICCPRSRTAYIRWVTSQITSQCGGECSWVNPLYYKHTEITVYSSKFSCHIWPKLLLGKTRFVFFVWTQRSVAISTNIFEWHMTGGLYGM